MSNTHDNQQNGSRKPLPRLTRYNSPGKLALSYQGARYDEAMRRMLARLPLQTTGAARHGSRPPLAALSRDIHDDWGIALVHAWAVVTEVLSFYQERITNEGYLRTATEYRSVLELARSIGYELRPGLSASTYLAFTVLSLKDEPPRKALVPKGTPVISVPGQGQLPQTFETTDNFEARAEWNTLVVARAGNGPNELRMDVTSIRLAGNPPGLRPESVLLIVGGTAKPGVEEPSWMLATIKTIKIEPQKGYTLVTWDAGAAISSGASPILSPVVFMLQPPVPVFGYTQSSVYLLDNIQHGWLPAAIGLPKATVRALAGSAKDVLFAGTDKDLFRSIDGGASWRASNVGLAQKDIHALVIDAQGNVYAGANDGSIFRSRDHGDTWTAMCGENILPPPKRIEIPGWPSSGPMPKTVVRALATYTHRGRSYLAAGTNDGVLYSGDSGKTWTPANNGLPKADWKTQLTSVIVRGFAVAQEGNTSKLFAATDAGVFRIRHRRSPLLALAVIALLAILGAWLLQNTSLISIPLLDWSKLAEAELSTPGSILVNYLVPLINVLLIGIILGAVTAACWLAVRLLTTRPSVSLGIPVHSLVRLENGALVAATAAGVFRSNDGAQQDTLFFQRAARTIGRLLLGDLLRRWQPASVGLTNLDVAVLAVGADDMLFCATRGGHVFRSPNRGDQWEMLNDAPSLDAVLALHAGPRGVLAGGTPIDAPTERRWSPFQLQSRQLDLDRMLGDIVKGGWMVLRQEREPRVTLRHAQSASQIDSKDALKPGKLTRVVVDSADGLKAIDRSEAAALAQGEPLAFFDDTPVEGETLVFDTFVPGIERGHRLIVSGKRIRAKLAEQNNSAPVALHLADNLYTCEVLPGESLCLVSRPGPESRIQNAWVFKNREGLIGTIDDPETRFILEPANDDDEVVSEVVVVKAVLNTAARTTVMLDKPLGHVYDRTTVAVYGNVVHASHGRTVTNELLGSSDSMGVNQRFLLSQPPLTYLPDNTPEGAASTLAIEVNGVRWEEVPDLHTYTRDQRVYMVRQHAPSGTPLEDGSSGTDQTKPSYPTMEVIFGNSTNGAGLPAGTWKIEASYRTGIGSAGNVPAGTLSVMQTALRDIKGVSNPIPGSGGANPETMHNAREAAPLTARALSRIVSLSDFEDFARAFAGIGRAEARLLSYGVRRLLHITVAGADGAVMGKDSDLLRSLSLAIRQSRAAPEPPVYIDCFAPLYFNVAARVLIDPAHQARKPIIEAAIRQALIQAFSFAGRAFGQPLVQAEVINVIQNVRGVVALDLSHLYVQGQPAALHQQLNAQPARVERNTLLPAQMLLINTRGSEGITLEIAP